MSTSPALSTKLRIPVSPESPENEQPRIGLIGMGEMGSMYARRLSAAGWKKIYVCDRPERYEALAHAWQDVPGVTVVRDGHLVSRAADWIMYSVEAEFIGAVVKEYGPSTKIGAVVSGQTSVKAPERNAFEKYLPPDVDIVSCHSLHGPSVSPEGQPLVLIQHRASNASLALTEDILRPFRPRFVYMSYKDHDITTANTQAVTHAAFLSMGTAWHCSSSYPWEHGLYVGGIETVKVNIMLRIYANKWHVYAGLAILNPYARVQIDQYASSVTQIFKLMLEGRKDELRERIWKAREKVFGSFNEKDANEHKALILLSEELLDQFSLSRPKSTSFSSPTAPSSSPNGATPLQPLPPANSHLSILAMVDSWAQLDIQPFAHLAVAATPIFRLWIGVAEALYRNTAALERAIEASCSSPSSSSGGYSFRADDLEFAIAARGWSQCISFGSFPLYQERFEKTKEFFKERFKEAEILAGRMIKTIVAEADE